MAIMNYGNWVEKYGDKAIEDFIEQIKEHDVGYNNSLLSKTYDEIQESFMELFEEDDLSPEILFTYYGNFPYSGCSLVNVVIFPYDKVDKCRVPANYITKMIKFLVGKDVREVIINTQNKWKEFVEKRINSHVDTSDILTDAYESYRSNYEEYICEQQRDEKSETK